MVYRSTLNSGNTESPQEKEKRVELQNVDVSEEKFKDYALNPKNAPEKAQAFKEALGYDLNNYNQLIENIEEHIKVNEFVKKGNKGFGMRYEYVMKLTGPNGKEANVLTAWIQDGSKKRLTSVYVTKKDVT